MQKKISIFLVVVILLSLLSQVSFASEDLLVKNKIIEDSKNVNVSIPVISGLHNKKIEKEINKDIEDTVKSIIENFKKDNKGEKEAELEIDFDVKSKTDVLSIVIEVEIDSPKSADTLEDRYYYNIGLITEEEYALKDLFPTDVDFKSLVNTRIKDQINLNRADYYVGVDEFKTIEDDQNFYVNSNGEIIVEFERGKVAPYSEGFMDFTVGSVRLVPEAYINYKYGYSFKLPPVWEDKVEIKEEGNVTKFIYLPENNKLKESEILSITSIETSKLDKDNKDYVVGKNEKYSFLTKVNHVEDYKKDKAEQVRYEGVIKALDGIDDLFKVENKVQTSDKKIIVDGQALNLKSRVIDGNLPVAEVLRSQGYTVDWDNATREVVVKKAELRSIIGTKENKYTKNNEEIKLDQGAFIVDGITYVPRDYFTKVLDIDIKL